MPETNIHGLGVEWLLAGKGEKALCERNRPLRAAHGIVHRTFQNRGIRWLRFELPLQSLQVAEDDGQEIVEIVGDAPGKLTDTFHFLRLAQGFFGLPPLGDLDCFGHDGHDRLFPVADGTHLEVEPAPPPHREVDPNLLTHDLSACDDRDRVAHGVGHARSAGEPRRLPEWLADDVLGPCCDAGKGSGIGVHERAIDSHQTLIGEAGFKDRSQARFLGL
jgi:hypothetical protein